MTLPATHLSIDMVKAELAAGTYDVGELCVHPNVNRWSKWKPIRSNKKGGLTLSDFQNANWGLGIPTFSNLDSLRQAYHNYPGGGADWSYLKPTGGASSVYRLDDFRNYDKTAKSPIGGYNISQQVYKDGPEGSSLINGSIIISQGSATQIGFEDLNSAYQYLGIALFSLSGELVAQRINSNPMASSVNINVSPIVGEGVPAGDYTAILFLSFSSVSVTNIAGLDKWPERLFRVSVLSNTISLMMELTYVQTTGQYRTLNIRLRYVNRTGNPINLLNCTVRVRYSYKDFLDTLIEGEKQLSLGTVTLEPTPESGAYKNYTIENVDSEQSWVVWWYNGGAYPREFSSVIMMEM